jgi:predicted RNase H-like nuclease (RuvC/YqgF family)
MQVWQKEEGFIADGRSMSQRYAMDPSPEEAEVVSLRRQVREQDATIKQLRNRIVQLEEVESAKVRGSGVDAIKRIQEFGKPTGKA